MATKHPFKVIIAGGGIAGLTLAIMLERFDIDYVLLEAYDDIAPAAGASIGMMPTGLLILDQLGCYESLEAVARRVPGNTHSRDVNGKSIACDEDMMGHVERRHGYPLVFFDRQWLLETLYDHVQHKDRIHLKRRIESVEHLRSAVQVKTTNGKTYTGDIVIGADGIHSVVRQEMCRIAEEIKPGYIPKDDQNRSACSCQCLFGISQNMNGWVDGDLSFGAGKGHSFLIASGPDRRCYWFLFRKLPEVLYGDDIPRYTIEDEAALVKESSSFRVTENLTFEQFYEKRLKSTLVAVHEVVFEKWSFGRMILVGDSAHKPNPIGGMGGNGAIESAAEFVNALLSVRDKRAEGLNGLTTKEIGAIGQAMQDSRHERAKEMVRDAHRAQALFAYESPFLSKLVWGFIRPFTGFEAPMERMGLDLIRGSRLNHLPVPSRRRVVPFNHELPARPLKSSITTGGRRVLVGGLGLALWVTVKAWRVPAENIGGWGDTGPLNRAWTGVEGFDSVLNLVTSALSYLVLGSDPAPRVHLIYTLSQLVSPLLIYTIEGYRVGNQRSLLSLPSIFLGGMQLQGIGRMAPLYTILSAFLSFQTPAGRFVRPEVAKVLLPALSITYILPTIMMFTPTPNVKAWQNWSAFWQVSPFVFLATMQVSSSLLGWWSNRKRLSDKSTTISEKNIAEDGRFDRYKPTDAPILKSVYGYAFAVQAMVHLATLAYVRSHPGMSFRRFFFNLKNPFDKDWNLPSVAAEISEFLRYDLVLASVGFLSQGLYATWDLRARGYVTTWDSVKAAAGLLVGTLVVGPSAALAAVWSWRESVLSGLSS